MRKGGGKSKGSAFERVVAHLVDEWWECAPGTFWRSVNSGGWHEAADVVPRSGDAVSWFPFVIECKFYQMVNLLDLFKKDSLSALLRKWWAKLLIDLKRAQEKSSYPKIGLLVFKYNHSPVFVAYEVSDYLSVPTTGSSSYILLNLKDFCGKEVTQLVVMLFEDFTLREFPKHFLIQYSPTWGASNEGQHQ